MRLLHKMVDSIQKSSVQFRFLLVVLLSLTMVHGSSNSTEIECPSGIITIISAINSTAIKMYQREAGTNSNYKEKSSKGYCQALIIITICTSSSCRLAEVTTRLQFNPDNGEVVTDDDIHFIPAVDHLSVSFGFKALGSYVDLIEEAANNKTNAKAKPTAEKLVALLKFVQKNGFPLDPPRSKEGDWNYVPNLLAPPRTTTSVATSKATTTASRSSSTKTNNPPSTIKPTDCSKCDCKKAPLRLLFFEAPDSSLGAASQEEARHSENPGKMKSVNDKELWLIAGVVAATTIAFGCFIWAVIERRKRMKTEKDYEKDLVNTAAVEHSTHKDALKAYLELQQIQKEIQDLQQDNPNNEKFRELENKMNSVIGLVHKIEGTSLMLRNADQRKEHDEIVDEMASGALDITVETIIPQSEVEERQEKKMSSEEKGKEDQRSNVEAVKSTTEQGSAQNKDVAKNGTDAKNAKNATDARNANDQKPQNKAKTAPKSKAEAVPKSKAEAAPKSKAEAVPKSKAQAAPKSKAEAVPKKNTEGAPK